MKKKLLTLATLALSFGFATEAEIELPKTSLPLVEAKSLLSEKKEEASKSFFYLKMSAADTNPVDRFEAIPGIGLGYRLNAGSSAIDFSANYQKGPGYNGDEKAYTYTAPKATYLYYLSPEKGQSFYGGAGLAWGGIRARGNVDAENVKDRENQRFDGLIPSVALGYEMNRDQVVKSFVQLEVSQAALPTHLAGSLPKPVAEFSLGAGF